MNKFSLNFYSETIACAKVHNKFTKQKIYNLARCLKRNRITNDLLL